jgi:hypothetical protein
MKRSVNVTLTILTAIALSACDDQDTKHCVDENGVVQDETNCNPIGSDGGVNPVYHPGFRWYYGGNSGGIWTPGTRVSGGSYTPAPHVDYSPPSIGRGGFGGTGEGFSTGGG